MSYKQWLNATKPKVAGTASLHNFFTDLDYFNLLSSVAGITGNVSQSNFSAGNCFEDALARQRTMQGKPAVSINLGPVMGVGLVADRGQNLQTELARTIRKTQLPIDFVLKLLEHSILFLSKTNPDDSQVVTGFGCFDALVDDPTIRRDRRFGTKIAEMEATTASLSASDRTEFVLRQLALKGSTLDTSEASTITSELLISQIADLFGMQATAIDQSTGPLPHYGMESLVAV
ncbi:unnamed protein product [Zymoseptoria tritici ST99CH_1A5]|uniref:Ketoreductase (KR) domain-containing protein n=2 Tax=Zymoseptoria tritici TaxID=1047171 RepID=A0A2H1GXF4_ZYMTR|nr:unnamed protein product [Zymoseptoria tritici ST99CH_1E4]SMY27426.1 unnamed protein product [Zymoseptoria tritici ST99CH_1A5]